MTRSPAIKPPPTLSTAAQSHWKRLAPELQAAGTLSQKTSGILAALCVAYARWEDAEKQLDAKGPIVKSPNGFPVPNPYLPVSQKAVQQIRQLSEVLGLTPKSTKPASSKSEQPPAPPGDLPQIVLHRGAG